MTRLSFHLRQRILEQASGRRTRHTEREQLVGQLEALAGLGLNDVTTMNQGVHHPEQLAHRAAELGTQSATW